MSDSFTPQTPAPGLDSTECRVVIYTDRRGNRWIVGIPGNLTDFQIGVSTNVLQHCFYDVLDTRVQYWKEMLLPNLQVAVA